MLATVDEAGSWLGSVVSQIGWVEPMVESQPRVPGVQPPEPSVSPPQEVSIRPASSVVAAASVKRERVWESNADSCSGARRHL